MLGAKKNRDFPPITAGFIYEMIKIEPQLQWQTDSKSYVVWPHDLLSVVCRITPFSISLNDPNPDFKVTPLFDAKYLRNDTRYERSYNGRYLHTPMMSFRMTLSDREW